MWWSLEVALAEELKRMVGKKAHLAVFRNFGTAQVKFRQKGREYEVEFVGARKESYSHDSRKPVVEDGTLEDDQNRRDFTINAMAICLNRHRFGELVDPFNGLADLEDGIIATPLEPDITFSDDPLRMMRCVRFATQLTHQGRTQQDHPGPSSQSRLRLSATHGPAPVDPAGTGGTGYRGTKERTGA